MAKARPPRQIVLGLGKLLFICCQTSAPPSFLLPIKCTLEIQLVPALCVVSSLKRLQKCLITDGCPWGENGRKRFIKCKFKKVR